MTVPQLKTVHVLPRSDALKAVYYDWEKHTLRPNLAFVDADGKLLFETNEIALKGDRVDATRKLVVVWGDSVVFGAGKGWACLLDQHLPNYQFLNGGIEGDPYDNILRRARLLNRQRAVALNLVMLGWHPFEPYLAVLARDRGWWRQRRPAPIAAPQRLRSQLASFLKEVPNTIMMTMPTALNGQIIGTDLSDHFRGGGDHALFQYCWPAPYSVELQQQIYEFITRRNQITVEVAADHGVPVIDLFAAFDTSGLADFRRDFIDFMHFRVGAYSRIAAAIHRGIAPMLD